MLQIYHIEGQHKKCIEVLSVTCLYKWQMWQFSSRDNTLYSSYGSALG